MAIHDGVGELEQVLRIIVEAERLLENLSYRPMDRYSVEETLFLSTRCRYFEGKLTVVADFGNVDLEKLRKIEKHSYKMDD